MHPTLSPRQWQIVDELLSGATVPEVAATLSVSANTVRTQIKRIYAKLEVSNRVELVFKVQEIARDAG